MVTWTAIGSLLHYFASIYGDHFFVYLNVAFYGIGLPLSYSQKKTDIYFDSIYGSKYMFRRRVWISLSILVLCLIIAPFLSQYGIIAMVGIVGICTWSCHGSVSSLASIVKMNSSTMQQIGFVLPGLYGIIIISVMDLEGEVAIERLYIFYYTTALLVIPGLIAWVNISPIIILYFCDIYTYI
jgi:hypothetical protein